MPVISMCCKTSTETSPDLIHQEIPNEETKIAIENTRNGIGLSRPFQSVQELMANLNDDDMP